MSAAASRSPIRTSTPPPLGAFFAEIEAAFERAGPARTRGSGPSRAGRWWPAAASVVVQVQQRRGDALYVNDGVYGSLSDAGAPGFRFPVRLIRPDGAGRRRRCSGFALFGPTCDSADRMRGPFLLPADVREGDWIEIGQLGAYGACLRTAFNGFDRARLVEVRDRPMLGAASPARSRPDAGLSIYRGGPAGYGRREHRDACPGVTHR